MVAASRTASIEVASDWVCFNTTSSIFTSCCAAARSSDRNRRIEIQAGRSVLSICDIRDGLVHRNAAFALVHHGENIARMDQLAYDDVDLLYLSIDPGAHRRD